MGGARPIVMVQCTGLFESGDALRNAVHDYRLPLFAFIGYRSYLSQTMLPNDSARTYTEPIVRAWQIDYRLIDVAGEETGNPRPLPPLPGGGPPRLRVDRRRPRLKSR